MQQERQRWRKQPFCTRTAAALWWCEMASDDGGKQSSTVLDHTVAKRPQAYVRDTTMGKQCIHFLPSVYCTNVNASKIFSQKLLKMRKRITKRKGKGSSRHSPVSRLCSQFLSKNFNNYRCKNGQENVAF